MALNEKSKTDDNDINLNSLIKIFFITFSVVLFGAIAYFIFHVAPSPLKPSEIGQIGDFYGGLLNPLLTFFTIIFLIWSIRLQSRELAATREELTFTREEIKQTAKSHKELVAQGNANFFIEQAIGSFVSSESEIKDILDMKAWITIHQNGEGPSIAVSSLHTEEEMVHEAIKLRKFTKVKDFPFLWEDGMERKIFLDANAKPFIKDLFQNIKHELINVNVIIEHHGWSHALTCLRTLKFNIAVLSYFKLDIQDERLIKELIDNAVTAIGDDLLEMKENGNQFATLYLLSDLALYISELLDITKKNPFDGS